MIYQRLFEQDILQEDALKFSDAKDYCLWIDTSAKGFVKFILFDPNPLLKDIFNGDSTVIENKIHNRFKLVFYDCILSTITISFGKTNPAVKVPKMAFVIENSSAKPGSGAGVLLYDIVMSWVTNKGKFLIPDRTSISNLAQKVWKYYFTKRGDVKKVPVDDIHQPVTKNKEDDGDLYSGNNIPKDKDIKHRNFANTMYQIKKPLNYMLLVKNNKDLFNSIKKKGVNQSTIDYAKALMWSVSVDFFANQYRRAK